MRLREGEVLAGYRVLRQLGRGGMAYVYLAEEAGSDRQGGALRQVALKLLPEDVADDAEAVLRFTQEAQTIAALEHPNIVPLYRHGIERGAPWMALRLVRGGDLAERLQRPLAVAEGLQIFRQIAQALDFAHRMQVIHRDLKPQNVLLSRDPGGETHAYLADFGIAKLLAGSARVRTGTGGILGTPQYMAPEVARGEVPGPAADIYALGVMIFQWQTSCLPFDADTPLAVLYKQVQEPLPEAPLRDLPAEVARVLRVALDKNAKARPASAVALVDQLATALSATAATAVTAASRARVEPAAGYPKSPGAPAPAPTAWAEPAEGRDPIRKAVSPQRPVASTPASTAARLNGWFWAAGLGLTGIVALAWWVGSHSSADVRPVPAVVSSPSYSPPKSASTPTVAEPDPTPAPVPTTGAEVRAASTPVSSPLPSSPKSGSASTVATPAPTPAPAPVPAPTTGAEVRPVSAPVSSRSPSQPKPASASTVAAAAPTPEPVQVPVRTTGAEVRPASAPVSSPSTSPPKSASTLIVATPAQAPAAEVSQTSDGLALVPLGGALPAVGVAFRHALKSGGEGPVMVMLPGGRFRMGSPGTEKGRQLDERPIREVSISPYAAGKFELTRGEFARFVAANPGFRTDAEQDGGCVGLKDGNWTQDASFNWRGAGFAPYDDKHPVICVSWDDAHAYVRWLAAETGAAYRLPSEAEQEYAIRAGSTTPYAWGDDPNAGCRVANGADQAMKRVHADFTVSTCDDGHAYTAPAGRLAPNGLGLHDVVGNVWEWVQDCYSNSYSGAPMDGSAVETANCAARVLRGAAWFNPPTRLRSADRSAYAPAARDGRIGFRLALDRR